MPDELVCPACRSKISTDGRTLLERSAHLADLEESADVLDKLEERVKVLKSKLTETLAENERLKAAPKPARTAKPKETKRVEKKPEEPKPEQPADKPQRRYGFF